MSTINSGLHIFGKSTQAATTSSASQAIPQQFKGRDLYVHNPSANIVYVALGPAAVAATATDFPVPAGQIRRFRIGEGHTHVAVLMSTGTATVPLFYGEGNPLA